MSQLFNPDKKFTQSDIGKLLGGLTDRQIRNLLQRGILPQARGRGGMDPLACIHAYISYKSQAQNATDEAEIPADNEESFERLERQLKIEDKRESILMKKAKRVMFEKLYAPIEMIVDVLQQVGGRLASRHEGLIPKMKIAWPDMPPEAAEVLENELRAAVNECTDILPDLSEYGEGSPESCPNWFSSSDDDHTSFGDTMV